MTLTIALSKFIICPALIALSDLLFAGVALTGLTQWVILGAIAAAFSIVSDTTLLDRLGHVGGFVADTIASTFVVWAAQFFLPGAAVTWAGAFSAGVLLGLSEIVMHLWVQASRRQGVRANRP